jgi:hypothetical protein
MMPTWTTATMATTTTTTMAACCWLMAAGCWRPTSTERYRTVPYRTVLVLLCFARMGHGPLWPRAACMVVAMVTNMHGHGAWPRPGPRPRPRPHGATFGRHRQRMAAGSQPTATSSIRGRRPRPSAKTSTRGPQREPTCMVWGSKNTCVLRKTSSPKIWTTLYFTLV